MINMDADVAIIGLGPAGLQAAIHAARKKVKVVALGKIGSSALNKADIENYFGIPGVKGEDLLRIGREQAQSFGASIIEADVVKLAKEGDTFKIVTETDLEIRAKAIVLAMGIRRVKLNVPGEKEFLGRGVSYCASCDAGFFRDRAVAVVGEESEAAESAILLSEIASQVYWVHRGLKVSPQMLKKITGTKIELIPGDPAKITGDKSVTALDLKDGRHLDVQGVFIALGAKGSLELALELGILPDPSGKISVDENCRTEMEMVYACGDVTGMPWQLARAVGQGAVAGDNAAKAVRQGKS